MHEKLSRASEISGAEFKHQQNKIRERESMKLQNQLNRAGLSAALAVGPSLAWAAEGSVVGDNIGVLGLVAALVVFAFLPRKEKAAAPAPEAPVAEAPAAESEAVAEEAAPEAPAAEEAAPVEEAAASEAAPAEAEDKPAESAE